MNKHKTLLAAVLLAAALVVGLGTALLAQTTWTAPRTWQTDEIVTAAMLNAHVRDNLGFLYDRRVDSGTVGRSALKTATGECTVAPSMTCLGQPFGFVPRLEGSTNCVVLVVGHASSLSYRAGSQVGGASCSGTQTLHYTYITASDDPRVWVRRSAAGVVAAINHLESPFPGDRAGLIAAETTTTDTIVDAGAPPLAILAAWYAAAPPPARADALAALRAYVVERGWLRGLTGVADLAGVPHACGDGRDCEPMARFVAMRTLASARGELVYDLVRRDARIAADGTWSIPAR